MISRQNHQQENSVIGISAAVSGWCAAGSESPTITKSARPASRGRTSGGTRRAISRNASASPRRCPQNAARNKKKPIHGLAGRGYRGNSFPSTGPFIEGGAGKAQSTLRTGKQVYHAVKNRAGGPDLPRSLHEPELGHELSSDSPGGLPGVSSKRRPSPLSPCSSWADGNRPVPRPHRRPAQRQRFVVTPNGFILTTAMWPAPWEDDFFWWSPPLPGLQCRSASDRRCLQSHVEILANNEAPIKQYNPKTRHVGFLPITHIGGRKWKRKKLVRAGSTTLDVTFPKTHQPVKATLEKVSANAGRGP